MLRGQGQSHRTLVRAAEVAIACGDLPEKARGYRKTDLLEALADAMGLARNALRNLYYRDEARFELVLQGYIAREPVEVARGLRALQFRKFSPIVWKRPPAEMLASRRSLPGTLILLQAAEKSVREAPDTPIEVRREVGTVAAEVMACALTFFDGQKRFDLLREGERIFKSAMGAMALELDVDTDDAALFAKFWENRATVCGMLWSDIWDDPGRPPTVENEVIELARKELDQAAEWARRAAGASGADGDQRLRQLNADKAKWLAKAGRFAEAWRLLDAIGTDTSTAAQSDRLLLRTLEEIANGRLAAAWHSARNLAELSRDGADDAALAPITSAMLAHHVDLLRGRTPALPEEVRDFLNNSPVAASEMLNLPRYRQRLADLGYRIGPSIN